MVMSLDKLNAHPGSIELSDRSRVGNNNGRGSNIHKSKVKHGGDGGGHNSTSRRSLKDVHEKENTLSYFLLEACKNGNVEDVEHLIRSGANANIVDSLGRSPLHLAVSIECSCHGCVKDADSCVALLLSSNTADANLQDDCGNTPLHMAIRNHLTSCTEMLISYGVDVAIKSETGEDAVSLMARQLPQSLVYLLNESIYIEQYQPHNERCIIRVDFRPIVGDNPELLKISHKPEKPLSVSSQSKNRIGLLSNGKEMKLLTSLLETSKFSGEKILNHPVVAIFLHLKWKRVRLFCWSSFMFYMLWVLMYSSYVLRVYLLSCPCDLFTKSTTANNRTSSDVNDADIEQSSKRKCEIVTGFSLEVILIIFSSGLLLLSEVGKLFITPRYYLTSWVNLGNWILILLVFSTTVPTLFAQKSISSLQYQAAAFTVFLAWAYILTQIGRLPTLAKYVDIFGHVLRCFGSFFLTFLSLFVAFALAFCILFPQPNLPYSSFFFSVLKVSIMMIGELDYQDMFYNESATDVFSPALGHLLYSLFVILVCIILMNLFVGLTVSDIQSLEKEAELARISRLIFEILHLEATIFSKRLPRKIGNFLKSYISVCQPNKGEKDGYSFAFSPNDPSDNSIPSKLKIDALRLAELSYRKSKSQRCTKIAFEPNPATMDVPSYFSTPARASSTSSQSSSPLETHSLDVAALGPTNESLIPRPSWTSCSSQR